MTSADEVPKNVVSRAIYRVGPLEELLTPEETAAILSVPTSLVHHLIAHALVPVHRLRSGKGPKPR